MLHIVLTILAVIGKILLVILALILLLILLVLFAPIRYKGTFRKKDSRMQAQGSVSWLLKLFLVKGSWIEGKLSYEIRIFGIPLQKLLGLVRRGKKEEAGAEESEEIPEPEKESSAEEELPELQKEISQEEKTDTEEKPLENQEAEAEENSSEEPEAVRQEEQAETPEEKKPGPLAAFLKNAAEKLKKIIGLPAKAVQRLRSISRRLKGLFNRASSLADRAKKLLDFLQSKLFREVFELTKKELMPVIRHILPRKIWGELEYGTGDPGTTGQILAAIAALYPVLPPDLAIYPDFEETLLNCDLSLKGRIRLFVPVYHGARLLLNKQVRKLINRVRHKEA